MKHVPVLLCGAILAGAVPSPSEATDLPHTASLASRSSQRAARTEAALKRAAATQGDTENRCLSMIADDPDGAREQAEDWARHGGGDGATRCGALAEIALGDPEGGAIRLDTASHDASLAASRRALLASDASHAWLLASRPDRALQSAGLAVALDPSPDHAVDHARAALSAHQPDAAIGDLSPVLAAHPNRTDALIVRATAFGQTGALDRARADIDAACRLQPDDPAALLERGVLRERIGDLDGARDDWSRVIAASPDTHEADLAQQDLALLEAGPEAR